MKAKRIIYGVPSKMEYHCILKAGSASFEVAFTGGGTNKQGNIIPATYMTDSLMMQTIIEQSPQFKNGLIIKVKTITLDKEVYIESEHVELASSVAKTAEVPEEGESDGNGGDGNEAEGENANEAPEEAGESDTQAEAAVETITTKEFACLDDARDFFEQEFGIKRGSASMRTKASITAYGKSNGIEVVFTD